MTAASSPSMDCGSFLVSEGAMTTKSPHHDLVLLNADGQDLLLKAFDERTRARTSYPDFADGYIRALDDTGVLSRYQLAGVDPFAVLDAVARFGLDRAIEMQRESFKWPSTEAPAGTGSIGDLGWPKVGLLKHLGYSVGRDGEEQSTRRKILDRVYLKAVPQVISRAYMREWGAPRTGPRLKKMANCIAAFARNAKKKDLIVMDTAITHWEGDLAYLKRKYYDGRYDFPWPPTG